LRKVFELRKKVSVTTYDAMPVYTKRLILAMCDINRFPVQGIEPQEMRMLGSK